jgi:N-methylhydantoinase B
MGQKLTELIWLALHPAMPDRVPASGKALIVNLGFGGNDPRRNEFYCYMETVAGGGGARPGKDGPIAVQTNLHNTENAPIEEVELNYPIRIARYGIIDDSGGAGRYRGGLGVRRDFEFPDADCIFTILSDGRKFAPWGLAGGRDGAAARFVLNPEGEARELPSKVTLVIPRGERVSVRTPGGGGFGDPRLRSRAAVAHDLRNLYISEETAREAYGFNPSDLP